MFNCSHCRYTEMILSFRTLVLNSVDLKFCIFAFCVICVMHSEGDDKERGMKVFYLHKLVEMYSRNYHHTILLFTINMLTSHVPVLIYFPSNYFIWYLKVKKMTKKTSNILSEISSLSNHPALYSYFLHINT